MELVLLLALAVAIVFAPVIVYYFLIQKSVVSGIWAALKIALIGFGISLIMPDGWFSYFSGLISTFIVFKAWHRPAVKSNWLILKYYILAWLLAMALVFVAFGYLFLEVFTNLGGLS